MTDTVEGALAELFDAYRGLRRPDGSREAPRGAALAWFRSAWPTLALAPDRLRSDDSMMVAFALCVAPFLVAVEDWAALLEVCRPGLEAAGRLEAGDEVRGLRGYLAAGLQRAGRDAEAVDLFERMASEAAARGDTVEEAAALAHLGQLRRAAGDGSGATGYLQRAVLAYRSTGDRRGEARASADLGRVLRDLGDLDEAVRYAQRARTVFRDVGDALGEAGAARDLAAFEAARGATDRALHVLDEAVELAESAGDDRAAAEARYESVQVHLRTADHDTARAVAADALDRAHRAGADDLAAELTSLIEIVTALAAADALTAATGDEEREAVLAARPEALGPVVRFVLDQRAAALAPGPSAARERIDAVRGFLDHRTASADDAGLTELRDLAGPAADALPPALGELLRRRAATSDRDEQAVLLRTAAELVPASVGHPLAPVRGRILLDLVESAVPRDASGRDTAVDTAAEAARLLDRPTTRELWAWCEVRLGDALRARGRPEDLDGALSAFRAALTVLRKAQAPESWAMVMVRLANVYWQRRRDATDLRRALHRHEAALAVVTPTAHPGQWGTIQSNLGLILTDPVLATDPANLEVGRRHLLAAIATPSLEPRARAAALVNLARCLRDRLEGDPEENLAAAVRHAREAYALRRELGDPIELAQAASTVGDTVGNAALLAGRPDDEAVPWFEEALALAPIEDAPLVHAGIADNLANALVQVEDVTSEHLRRAISLQSAAAALYADGDQPIEEARVWFNLAMTVQRTDPPQSSAAVEFLERSLRVRTVTRVPLDWAASVTALAQVWLDRPEGPDPQRAVDLLDGVLAVLDDETATGHVRRAATLLGGACSDLGRWADAAAAFERALAAAERRYRATVLPEGRDAEIVHTADLAREAAYAIAATGEHHRAVEVLETGRARGLGDRLDRDRADLAALDAQDPAAASAFRGAAERVRAAEAHLRAVAGDGGPAAAPSVGDPGAADTAAAAVRGLRARLTDARAELEAAVARIHRRPGFAAFLGEPPAEAVTAAARPGVPLAYLVVARHGALTLVVSTAPDGGPPRVDAISGSLTDKALMEALSTATWEADGGLDPLLDLLGEGLVAALADRLRELGASGVVLVATGALGMLPVHAARYGPARSYLVDEVTVSYTPSARVLRAARASAARGARAGAPARWVGVAEPQPCDPPLRWATREVEAVARLVPGPTRLLSGTEPTVDAVLGALAGTTHLHFAGHGRHDPDRPLDSALLLARGEELTLRRLFDTSGLGGVRLVVASACRTAGTDMARLPDEALGLPAGLVQAGAAAVIGTLWEVHDRPTAVLVTRFYRTLLQGDPDREGRRPAPAAALAAAQRWMAHADPDEIERFAVAVGLRRRTWSAAGPADGSATGDTGQDRGVDPRHWAAFVLVGDGGRDDDDG